MLKPGRYEVLVFSYQTGESPYLEWLDHLDWKTQERVLARVARIKQGQFGDYKQIDRSLYELRLFFGPGYRVYFGKHRATTVLILAGGDKSSQSSDIKKAKALWKIYQEDHP